MSIEFLDIKDAPEPPAKPSSKRAAEFIEMVENLPKNKVAKISPKEDQSLRGIKVSVGRIASNRSIKVRTWDDGTHVYVRREQD